jgi:PGF-CTERM protein
VRNLDPVTASAQVGEGTTVTVSATVVNVGGEEATQDINLLLAGNVADTESGVTLGEGESRDVSFDVSVDDLDVEPGTYEHGIASADDEQTGGLTIEAPPPEPPDPDPASFEVISLAPSEATVTQGDQVVVTVAIQNVGGQEGSETISLNIDGINDSSSLTLAANESGEVTFTVDTSDVDAGDYTHTVSTESGSEASGSLTVEEPEPADDTTDDNTTEDDSEDGSGAGFGVVVAALALLGAALLAMRRQVE